MVRAVFRAAISGLNPHFCQNSFCLLHLIKLKILKNKESIVNCVHSTQSCRDKSADDLACFSRPDALGRVVDDFQKTGIEGL